MSACSGVQRSLNDISAGNMQLSKNGEGIFYSNYTEIEFSDFRVPGY
jgi:hypothetical protein